MDENYFKTGKAKLTYKYFPVVNMRSGTGESYWSAYAAECANEQGKFWEYHDKLFSVWAGENVGTYSKANLKRYAAELGLDISTFNQCLDTDKTAPIIQKDIAEATRLAVNATPTFFINNQLLTLRSLDYSEFARAIDSIAK